jgi:hypothetical protein
VGRRAPRAAWSASPTNNGFGHILVGLAALDPPYSKNRGGEIMAKMQLKKAAPKKAGTKKNVQQDLIANMQVWRKVENASIASTGRVIEKTENPIIRLVMEVIQRDSQMHYRVQEYIAETLSGKPVSLSPDEIGEVWGLIEDHINLEKKTLELAQEALAAIKGSKGMLVQSYLLEYLMEDETKHNSMLERLGNIQRGMYPYA